MIKQLLSNIDLSIWAEVSLVMFASVFVAVAVRTLLTGREETQRQANLALSDPHPERTHE